MLGNVLELINVSTSDEVENRQDLCKFTIFLHNANDLKDVENISLTASLEILEDNFTLFRQVTFSVIPTVLVILSLLDLYSYFSIKRFSSFIIWLLIMDFFIYQGDLCLLQNKSIWFLLVVHNYEDSSDNSNS